MLVHRSITTLLVGSALFLTQGPAISRAMAATKTVNIRSLSFDPKNITITVGDTVHWVWVSGSHSTTSGSCSGGICTANGIWSSATKSSGSFDHTFNTLGTFNYFCVVHGAMMTGKVTVEPPPPVQANASASTTCGVAPLPVTFTGSATGGTPPYQFSWTFGDGQGSNAQSPLHTYTNPGDFTATLTVMDGDGSNSSDTVGMTVSDVPLAVITKVRKLTDPFRLKIIGTGFPDNCTVLINGVATPRSNCASDVKVVAGRGRDLSELVPKGVPVVVTVRDNDSGRESCPFTYTRPLGAGYQEPEPPGPYLEGEHSH